MKLIGICGGIGSGKSVVARVLTTLGYDVYDCDSRAKLLMNNSAEIKTRLCSLFGDDVLTAVGQIDKRRLSEIIFNDGKALNVVNAIVHPAVVQEIVNLSRQCGKPYFFFESALPQESGLDVVADEIWLVEAPLELRVERVAKRSGLTNEEILQRINSQDYSRIKNDNIYHIVNDGIHSIINKIQLLTTKSNLL